MPRKSAADDNIDVGNLVEQLTRTAPTIDADDLSALAQMHGWCETLTKADQPATGAEEVKAVLQSLTRGLESLILGDTDEAGAVLGTVKQDIETLAGLMAGATMDNDEPRLGEASVSAEAAAPPTEAAEPTTPESAELSDAEVAERMTAVFDEPVASDAVAAVDSPEPTAPPEAEPAAETGISEPPATADEADAAKADADLYESEPLTLNEGELDFVKGFVEEAGEHVQTIESALLEVERSPEDTAKIDDLFRPFHTIKGMAGFLNLRDINCLTHEVETLLDHGRKGSRPMTPGLIDLVFDVVDILKVQIAAVGDWVASPSEDVIPQPPVSGMINKLRNVISGKLQADAQPPYGGSPDNRVGENLVEQGSVPQEVVEYAAETQSVKSPDRKVGEVLADMNATTPREISHALRPQAQGANEPPEPTAPPAAGGGASSSTAAKPSAGEQSVRIDTAKLDGLVDTVGELVIAQTLVSMNDAIHDNEKLLKDVGQVSKIVRDVQEMAMAMRMVPIGPTFQRMARLVRDVSRKAGKKVNLTISGEDTELDKNVIQQIGDPLIHMVRNAVDHGVESPEERIAAGKSEEGSVHLHAGHQGGNIVIDIRDDGKGLDAAALVRKAVERGVVKPGEELKESEAYSLIFAPGFSTAEQVTDISGRGVGMDVVKRNIDSLRGRVEISSEKGHGSTFSIRLPLTLAIIDGMVIRLGRERFIIPTITIDQSLRPKPEQITSVQHRGEVINVRGRLIPLVQLGQLFGLTDRVDPCEAMVVLTHCEGRLIGLVIEDLIGQQQVVIKTLGERFRGLSGISGAAILGDGRIGLILEMTGIEKLHSTIALQTDVKDKPSVSTVESTSTSDQIDEVVVADESTDKAETEEPVLAGA